MLLQMNLRQHNMKMVSPGGTNGKDPACCSPHQLSPGMTLDLLSSVPVPFPPEAFLSLLWLFQVLLFRCQLSSQSTLGNSQVFF